MKALIKFGPRIGPPAFICVTLIFIPLHSVLNREALDLFKIAVLEEVGKE
jgi:hypothetical protein